MAELDSVLRWILTIVLLATGGGGLLVGAYLVAVSAASFFYRSRQEDLVFRHHLVVLVPAHNEAELLGRCLSSLSNQDYGHELYRVVVIADNCTDETAGLARGAGVEVLERNQPGLPGKGRALRWAMDRILSEPQPPDAFVVVDADSVADRGLLTGLDSEFQGGAQVVQGLYLALPEHDRRVRLGAVALLLFHYVRFAGRAVLGMGASLVGNGMLLSADVMRATPWDAFSVVEDLEFTVTLRCAGVRPRFAGAARIYAPVSISGAGARSQRRRWEGGRFFIVRQKLPLLLGQVVRRADWQLLDEALELTVPPLGLLALFVLAGSAVTALLTGTFQLPTWLIVPWFSAAFALPLYIGLGLIAARAPRSAYLALLRAPLFVIRKMGVYGSLVRRFDPHQWVRTPRPAEATVRPRVRIGGIPLDAVDMSEALRRLVAAVPSDRAFQVCTINLDFLVRARTDPVIRSIFAESDLNLADGIAVVWLARLQGDPLPERVAGADLVPHLMREAARRGASVYLLGGENGVARDAAQRLRQTVPGLRIAGWYEPPRAPIETMENTAIVREINQSGADILLVALGHPKQDRWIAMHRDELRVSVAIGVGCCLDLIAGRVKRAPAWMQRLGLEWLFRAMQEPRRLARRYAVDLGSLGFLLLPALLHRFRDAG